VTKKRKPADQPPKPQDPQKPADVTPKFRPLDLPKFPKLSDLSALKPDARQREVSPGRQMLLEAARRASPEVQRARLEEELRQKQDLIDAAIGVMKESQAARRGKKSAVAQAKRQYALAKREHALRMKAEETTRRRTVTTPSADTHPIRPRAGKAPTPDQRKIAMYYATSGKTQTECAVDLSRTLKKPVTQPTVSKTVGRVNQWRRSQGLAAIPTRKKGVAKPVDPKVIDMGQRSDGRSERQRERKKAE
jgi:hypothetical protein